MKGKRFTEEQIVAVLKEGQAGCRVGELCRKYGISEPTYCHWKAKYAGMTVSDLRKLKALEEENRRLTEIVADQALDIWAMKHTVLLDFIDPGKPMQHAFRESFQSRLRDECLNQHWFISYRTRSVSFGSTGRITIRSGRTAP